MIGNFPAVSNFNRLFLELNRFVCNSLPVLPDHCWELMAILERNLFSVQIQLISGSLCLRGSFSNIISHNHFLTSGTEIVIFKQTLLHKHSVLQHCGFIEHLGSLKLNYSVVVSHTETWDLRRLYDIYDT